MEFGTHWYDRLWTHLEDVAESGDERKFNALMDIRATFASAEGKEEHKAVEILFNNWEMINA